MNATGVISVTDFWGRVKSVASERGVTQRELSRQSTGIDAAIANWSTKHRWPDPPALARMADMLNVTMEYLITGKESRSLPVAKAVRPLLSDLNALTPGQLDVVAVQIRALANSR